MGLRVTILNATTGAQIRLDNIQGQSSAISFFGTDPKSVLKDALDDYIKVLYPQ